MGMFRGKNMQTTTVGDALSSNEEILFYLESRNCWLMGSGKLPGIHHHPRGLQTVLQTDRNS